MPGAADRIIRLAEEQAKHRQQLESITLQATVEDTHSERKERRIGQFCGVAIAMTGLIAGAIVIVQVGTWPGSIAGFALGGSGLAAIVSIFVLGRKDNTDSEEE